MKHYLRTFRAFTLLELFPVIVLVGAFAVVAAPLTHHVIQSTGLRTKVYDEIFLVTQISDRIRSDLKEPGRQVVTVEPQRLLIRSGRQTIEYRTDGTRIERLRGHVARSSVTAAWDVPYTTLTFVSEQGKPGAVLVGLRWSLGGPKSRHQPTRKVDIAMDFAAAQETRQLSILEN